MTFWFRCVAAGAVATLAACLPAAAQTFKVHPPGQLEDPKAKGVAEYKGYAPGMRFPIATYPATLNSQVYGHGGYLGPQGTSECDEKNFSGAWSDNYCEARSLGVGTLCPSGKGHAGVDIRAGNARTCARMKGGQKNLVPVVAVFDGVVTHAKAGGLAFDLTVTNGDVYRYLHMDIAADLTDISTGSRVRAGQIIGYVSNMMNGRTGDTTLHLHLEHHRRMVVEGTVKTVQLPLYCDLVLAYERDRGLKQEMIGGGRECGDNGFTVAMPPEQAAELKPGMKVTLNGQSLDVESVDAQGGRVGFLGQQSALLDGLNELKAAARNIVFWRENEKLSAFAEPYAASYAVIAAIDDYDRAGDPAKRGPTGFRALDGMVARAEELKAELMRHGFPAENIVTLYNAQATSAAIDDALGEFQAGGNAEKADRVLVYFGGHGAGQSGSGYLVTYDYDQRRPTRTSFPMSRFVAEHFPAIKARQVLVALDSCSSGLALQGMLALDGEPKEDDLKRFATLATIRSEAGDKARNIMVAGTGEQKALEKTGGVFTRALIEGLKGEADYIKDGVVQFDELSLYVTRSVRSEAAKASVRQDPRAFVATDFGQGKVMFLSAGRH